MAMVQLQRQRPQHTIIRPAPAAVRDTVGRITGTLPHGRHAHRGSSLIEQIMVLVIIASLLSVATPSLRKLLTKNQLQAAQADFMSGLQAARATAITSGQRTIFCPSTDGARCSGSSRWESGWLLARDADTDKQPDGTPIYSGHGYARKLVIQSTAGRHFVRFSPEGTARGSNTTLLFCSPGNPESALTVVVSNAGRVRGAKGDRQQVATCAGLGDG